IGDDIYCPDVWQDEQLQNDYVHYYLSKNTDQPDLCYIIGKFMRCSTNHPSKIRHSGDKAKLISANDESNFTFKGRYDNAQQAATVGFESSQKMHNALKYLISTQGERIGDKVFLLWGTMDENVPKLNSDTFDLMASDDDLSEYSDTKRECAIRFNRAINGYKENLVFSNKNSKLAIIGLDAATTGRMSIIYYKEFIGLQCVELIENIEHWHESCQWYHTYRTNDKKVVPFYGVPSAYKIALCACANDSGGYLSENKINRITIANIAQRLIPCITEKRKIPRDVVSLLIRKSLYPLSYENQYNWDTVLSVTCSMYKKYLYDYKGEEITMTTDTKNQSISFKCGRLLAVADKLEYYALYLASGGKNEKIRTTNAMRFFTQFHTNPSRTWIQIEKKLIPYINYLGSKAKYYTDLIDEIANEIDPEEFLKLKHLNADMLIGFHSQRYEINERI
ncbi:MAG: type I-C CRISPR-associated protein Cas8c/Csd1, partial [Oscillospiraceae bacterium]